MVMPRWTALRLLMALGEDGVLSMLRISTQKVVVSAVSAESMLEKAAAEMPSVKRTVTA